MKLITWINEMKLINIIQGRTIIKSTQQEGRKNGDDMDP